MPNVWIFTTDTRRAYDETQTNQDIKDGDVLIVPNEDVVGIMFYAWPTAITTKNGEFHTFDQNRDVELFQVGVDNSDRFPIEDRHLEGIETAERYIQNAYPIPGQNGPNSIKVVNDVELAKSGTFRIIM